MADGPTPRLDDDAGGPVPPASPVRGEDAPSALDDAAQAGREAIAFFREAEGAAKRLVQLAAAEAQLSYGALRTAFLAGILRNVMAGVGAARGAAALFAAAGAIALAQWLDSWPLALVIIGTGVGIGAFVAAILRRRAWARVGMPNTRELLKAFTAEPGKDDAHQ